MSFPHNYISMESRGCNPELLKELYIIQNRTLKEIREKFNIKDEKVLNRWLSQSGISKKENRGRYSFDRFYFDDINSEEKAYWLGFIWCDGYVCKRVREGKVREFQIKLSLSEKDIDHLDKLKVSLNSNHPIHLYTMGKKSFQSNYKEARLMISNMYFGEVLYEKYGLIPNRKNIAKLIAEIPYELHRHFIRGVFDAEGSLTYYYHTIKEGWKPSLKIGMSIYTYEELIDFIQEFFIRNKLKENKINTYKRHKDRDLYCKGITFSGSIQVPLLLDYLYNNSTIFLERKHQKYLEIKELVSSVEKGFNDEV